MTKRAALDDIARSLGKHVSLLDYAKMEQEDVQIFITSDRTPLPERMGEGTQTTKRLSIYHGDYQKSQIILETTTVRKGEE